jgi:hypothetical protein
VVLGVVQQNGRHYEVLVLKVLGAIVGFGQFCFLIWLFLHAAIQHADEKLAVARDKGMKPRWELTTTETQPSRNDEPYDGSEFVDDDTWWGHV